MGTVLENSLYLRDKKNFLKLKENVTQFNSSYNGQNIIQDDIFSVLVNYARKNETILHLFRFPTDDDDFCALTCVKKGQIFVYVNSNIPLANQIFAAAHELYHIWRYISEEDESVLRKGSLLNAYVMNEEARSKEDVEANAFAGLFLVPSNALFEQMNIYGISREKQSLEDIFRLMAIFAVPYKAILLRLFEEGYMSEQQVSSFLEVNQEQRNKMSLYDADVWRWQRRTSDLVVMGGLDKLLEYNHDNDLLTDSREASDRKILAAILNKFERL